MFGFTNPPLSRINNGHGKKIMKRIISIIFSVFVFCLILLTIGVFFYFNNIPNVKDAPSRVQHFIQIHKGIYVAGNIPQKLQEATIAVEDRRFYSHHGLDIIGFVKTVFLDQITKTPNGGATISEQLAKNLYVNQEDSVKSKLETAGLAVKLERNYSKEEILTMYVNAIYYGNLEYGIGKASQGYFHSTPANLDWAQASLLAGLPQAPTYYNPEKNLPAAKARQQIVLNALVRQGFISQKQAEDAYNEKLKFF